MSELQRITEELVAELIKHKALLTEVLNNASVQQLVAETRVHLSDDNATESTGEVDKTSTTYAEYLWRERTEPVFNVAQQPSIQSNVIQGCDHLYAGLAPHVEQSNYELEVTEFAYCPLCGAQL